MYTEVADTEKVANVTLTTKLITLSNKILEESKKQIKKEDGKIFSITPEKVKKELEEKTVFFHCWSVESR